MKILIGLLFLGIVATSITSCTKVPLTGRKQLSLVPESQMVQMSLTNYSDFLKQSKLSDDKRNAQMVYQVGQRISFAVEDYLKKNGYESRVKDFAWEYKLVSDSVPNAWCMPGGKVVVYTGILPYTQNENGLAVVIGHEIAHAVARHGNERMSQGLIAQMGGMALDLALQSKPEQTRGLFMEAYGVGTQVGVTLPFSRQHEYEADKLGLIFMTMAGYNPQEAVTFWERMSTIGGSRPPEFLSTHPADSKRIEALKGLIPEMQKYKKGN